MANLAISYSRKDLPDVLLQLYKQLGQFTNGQWTDFLNSDAGNALVQTIAYMNDANLFYTDANTAECFLSTCQLLESGIRKAKELNYNPPTIAPATCQVLLTFPSFNHQVNLPALTIWSIGGILFTCLDPITIPMNQTSLQISLTQGTPYSATVTAPGQPWFSITVPPNACEVVVSDNDVVWDAVDTWINIPESNSYKIYTNTNGLTIEFGNGLTSTQPSSGDTITVTGLLTSGAAGNVANSGLNVTPQSALIDPYDSLSINNQISAVSLTAALGGANAATLEQIQQNAPSFYGTGGRVVTKNDYGAIVKDVSGVVDYVVVGGENLGFYRYVYITAYGDNPYSVSPTLLNNINDALTQLNMLSIIPVVQAPTIFELSLTVNLGLAKNSFTDASQAQNLVNAAITTFFSAPSLGGNMAIGNPLYNSQLVSTIQAIPGITYCDVEISLQSFVNSSAGIIRIPLPSNADVTNCTLVDDSDNVLFSGDGSQYVSNNTFTFAKSGLSNQQCTLTFTVTPPDGTQSYDVLIAYNQLIVISELTINSTILQ